LKPLLRQLNNEFYVLIGIMKFLVTGLGNIGAEYADTRHNIGFTTLDFWAKDAGVTFEDKRYGMVCEIKYKGRIFVLLKPSTYVNRSGLAVNYYLKKEKLTAESLFVIVDDIALAFGTIRIKPKGSSGGHNGLQNIVDVLATDSFARMRFGIGGNFHQGGQVDYVLGKWMPEELDVLPDKIARMVEAAKSFGTIGLERTMNIFNTK